MVTFPGVMQICRMGQTSGSKAVQNFETGSKIGMQGDYEVTSWYDNG